MPVPINIMMERNFAHDIAFLKSIAMSLFTTNSSLFSNLGRFSSIYRICFEI